VYTNRCAKEVLGNLPDEIIFWVLFLFKGTFDLP